MAGPVEGSGASALMMSVSGMNLLVVPNYGSRNKAQEIWRWGNLRCSAEMLVVFPALIRPENLLGESDFHGPARSIGRQPRAQNHKRTAAGSHNNRYNHSIFVLFSRIFSTCSYRRAITTQKCFC
jgi:hypothetical protein